LEVSLIQYGGRFQDNRQHRDHPRTIDCIPAIVTQEFPGWSVAAVVTFVLTTSFLLSTPGAVQLSAGISILGPAGQFLIKDLVLLGGSIYIASEALQAAQGP
jgi:hypothetical protein